MTLQQAIAIAMRRRSGATMTNPKRWWVILPPSMSAIMGCSPSASQPPAKIANPASQHCVDQGGKLEIRTGPDGGQYGICRFANGSECEEWAFQRGECQPT
jgi:putative hemolysin